MGREFELRKEVTLQATTAAHVAGMAPGLTLPVTAQLLKWAAEARGGGRP